MVEESSLGSGSMVDEAVIDAVLVIVDPAGTLDATLVTTVKLVVPPSGMPDETHDTVPEVSEHPADAETKLVPVGKMSDTVNPALSDGPELVTVIV